MKRALLFLVLGSLAGCTPADPYGVGKTAPVSGSVLVNGKPMKIDEGTFGRVWFHPDASKGNVSPQAAVADVDAAGQYVLTTRGQPGAPLGWYKVMVVATEKIDARTPRKKRASLVHAKYGSVETSKLAVEVVAKPTPEQYDLKLSK